MINRSSCHPRSRCVLAGPYDHDNISCVVLGWVPVRCEQADRDVRARVVLKAVEESRQGADGGPQVRILQDIRRRPRRRSDCFPWSERDVVLRFSFCAPSFGVGARQRRSWQSRSTCSTTFQFGLVPPSTWDALVSASSRVTKVVP